MDHSDTLDVQSRQGHVGEERVGCTHRPEKWRIRHVLLPGDWLEHWLTNVLPRRVSESTLVDHQWSAVGMTPTRSGLSPAQGVK